MSAQEMEQDRQRHEDVPSGLEGAGYREQGQSVRRVEPLGTVIAKKKKNGFVQSSSALSGIMTFHGSAFLTIS